MADIMEKEPVIEVHSLTKQYMKNVVLSDVSFTIKKGMICGLVGPNGAGKTTIMKALGGLILPTKGGISLFGETDEKGLARSRSRMSFLIEMPYAKQGMTARENLQKLMIQKGLPDKSRIDEVLEITGLGNVGKKLVKNYSLGMKQRLGIACSLLSKPEIMVLDEPINGLDPDGIIEIRELLLKLNREENVTIIISSHILSELSHLCTDYIFIKHGSIIENISAAQLRERCKENIHIRTMKDAMVPAVLENELGIHDYEVDRDGSVHIYERLDDIGVISATLTKNGIIPTEIHMNDADLEKFYLDLTGDK